jgi:hypothetical protein
MDMKNSVFLRNKTVSGLKEHASSKQPSAAPCLALIHILISRKYIDIEEMHTIVIMFGKLKHHHQRKTYLQGTLQSLERSA